MREMGRGGRHARVGGAEEGVSGLRRGKVAARLCRRGGRWGTAGGNLGGASP